jgi:hypothetical protein
MKRNNLDYTYIIATSGTLQTKTPKASQAECFFVLKKMYRMPIGSSRLQKESVGTIIGNIMEPGYLDRF